jgi:hypothetical protein
MILAYVVYFGLLMVLVACWWTAMHLAVRYPARDKAIGIQATWFSMIVFTLLIGFRYPLTGDFFGYIYYYQSTTLADRPSDVVFEPGFLWLIQLLKFFDAPDRSIIIASSFIQILLFSLWLKDKKSFAPFVSFFFVTILLLDINNLIRQGIALFAIFIALDSLNKKKIISFAIYSFLGYMFHRSAIIIFPLAVMLWYARVPRVYVQIATLLIAYMFVGVFYGQVIGIFERLSPTFGYDGYGDITRSDLVFEGIDSSLNLGRYLWPLIDGIIIIYSRALSSSYDRYGYRFYHVFFLVGALLQPVAMAWDFLPFARALFYFTAMRIVCLGFLIRYCLIDARSSRNVILGCGICAIFVVWLAVAVSRGSAGSAPYAFW